MDQHMDQTHQILKLVVYAVELFQINNPICRPDHLITNYSSTFDHLILRL
ncbi:hypothetical protein AXF42_Ash020174 [Apostasia shenzhenica]|uniref:Uncharacterized protein n=1 Tax=Apostasia shenzhenica TaxID=1088818 RepID=A0A2H9ZVW0_9ASPA|nr:hypothetical protein AXF42_Ash020174 [Apostasia shenzhenica]